MPDVPDVINAKAFHLVDDNGKLRAELTMAQGFPELRLLDSEGTTLLSAEVHDDGLVSLVVGDLLGSNLHASVNDGHPGLELIDFPPGSGLTRIAREGVNGRIDLGFNDRCEMHLLLLGNRGLFTAEVDPSGNSVLSLQDEKSRSRGRRTVVTADGIKKNQ